MKLQVAIDRIALEEAVGLARALNGHVDIIEIGTSLIKDYGNVAIEKIKEVVTGSQILVDSKTIDEGTYEFNQAFKYGADIVTVMGAASYETLLACYEVTQQQGSTMMIDLLNLDPTYIASITDFPQAIYLLHSSVDKQQSNQAVSEIMDFKQLYGHIQHLAIAGGVDYNATQALAAQGIVETVVVGSKITNSESPIDTAKKFMEVLKV
ncbi:MULTISPECIES: orotidine 5'-phosphate decarboxylase / HUMPS family protein [Staphylococcus]|uniref:orotidine 5'-phosphate decarboxylase / HUMPS family protein n=1 Tax=Staphylococcus TaxID=1279 RepID=UPI00062BE372|nr:MULTISPECIES: orotidine 5'-phosphate decarboxylase / HUMPS family protein [Staphylococcus]MDH9161107.1 orotidine 5'-phosphate decarboxylase [Staphylococcus succinus]OIJ31492.1 3-hexulose-6-phosphate synthase [Staphylococcus sp. LCT-H4]PNZ18378.1 3-hexulose-6-phosphate synthase [Staphylococcus succinus subsp. succinus]RIN40717.1 3-hexulose-6-phosphate synthase [Staphylococcus succinus]